MPRGFKLSRAQRRKVSAAGKRSWRDPETRQRRIAAISAGRRGLINYSDNVRNATLRRKYLDALKQLRERRRRSSRAQSRDRRLLPWDPSKESYPAWVIRYREAQRPTAC